MKQQEDYSTDRLVRSLCVFVSTISACALLTQAETVLTPRSLSAAFEDNLATQEWERAYIHAKQEWILPDGATLPFNLQIRDIESGKTAPLTPGVAYSVDARQRWGGRDLGVDWVLLLDRATDIVQRTTLSVQLKSATPRFLQLELGPRVDATNWTLHTATGALRIARTLTETSDTIPTRLGTQGERAQHPFGIVEVPPLALLIGVNPTEPRLYQITTRPENTFLGVRFEVALSPETKLFPGRAAFQCTFAAWPAAAGTYALEQATEIWRHIWPDTTNTTQPANTDTREAAPLANTQYPLVFTPRIRTPQTLDAQSAWTLHALPSDTPDALLTLEHSLTNPAIAELENFARDARVKISADSVAPGFNPEALADGVREPTSTNTTSNGWCSADTATNHTVHLDFPHPTSFSELHLYWPEQSAQSATPHTLRISGTAATGIPTPLVTLDNLEPAPSTAIPLPSLQLNRLTIEMPKGAGPAERPNQFCISELELR